MPNRSEFKVESGVAFEGGDGEAIATWGSRIATLGSHQATWWTNETPHTVELGGIPVRGARWSSDGNALLAGTGVIDVTRKVFTEAPAVAGLVARAAPGRGSVVIHSASWSADQQHVAALLKWSGPRHENDEEPSEEVMLVDLSRDATPIAIPATGASGVRIAEDKLVVAGPVIRIWSFAGELVADLPATSGAPLAISGGDGGPLIVLDQDWSIRVIDVASWTVRARWPGKFLDAVAVPGGLIAIDHQGTLHAGCLEDFEVLEVGTFDTGILAAQLAATADGRLVIMGAGPVLMHSMKFELTCNESAHAINRKQNE